MKLFDFFKKKKDPPKLAPSTARRFIHINNIKKTLDNGEEVESECVGANDICQHLKVKGTKYYKLVSESMSENQKKITLFLRCKYDTKSKRYRRLSFEDAAELISAFTVAKSATGPTSCIVSLRELLDKKIDYILIDLDEATGETFYYYSFKGKDEADTSYCEGYVVINSKEEDLNGVLFSLM